MKYRAAKISVKTVDSTRPTIPNYTDIKVASDFQLKAEASHGVQQVFGHLAMVGAQLMD